MQIDKYNVAGWHGNRAYNLRELLTNIQLSEIDASVQEGEATYKDILECLDNGLSLEEALFVFQAQGSLPFTPSATNLTKLFRQLRSDRNLFNDAIAFLEENYHVMMGGGDVDVENSKGDDRIISKFSKMLEQHGNSLKALGMYLESFED
jgi:hypothetical protein